MKLSKHVLGHCLSWVIAALLLGASASAWADHRPGHEKGGGKPSDGSGSDSGNDIKLSCVFDHLNGENIIHDFRNFDSVTGTYPYDDGDMKVTCSTGGTSQPNLSGINLVPAATGKFSERERELDLALEQCTSDPRCMTKPQMDQFILDLPNHMKGLFRPGAGNEFYDKEHVTFSLRPYRDAEIPERWSGLAAFPDGYDHGGDHIQKLRREAEYRMALRIALRRPMRGDPRVVINLAGHHVPEDQFQGVLCAPASEPPEAAVTEDVRVTVAALDKAPLLYTIDTYDDPSDEKDDGYMLAAICSNMPVGSCGNGKEESNLCNFHGLVKAKLNFMAFELP